MGRTKQALLHLSTFSSPFFCSFPLPFTFHGKFSFYVHSWQNILCKIKVESISVVSVIISTDGFLYQERNTTSKFQISPPFILKLCWCISFLRIREFLILSVVCFVKTIVTDQVVIWFIQIIVTDWVLCSMILLPII